MKATGIVRALDQLGRIVIPKETRRVLNINEGDQIEIFLEDENIVLKKYKAGCHKCGEVNGLKEIPGLKDIKLCPKCLKSLALTIGEEVSINERQ